MPGTRVTLRFDPNNKSAIVDQLLEPYAVEASETIEFPMPGTAALVLPSKFVAEELADKAVASPLCEEIFVTYY
ncbi:MAG: hypothetical protein HZA25_02375 [Candidatus Niyogibacteria bacterium]|nr:hypothetical protein [Candidatus Niyogibacteria bacterium]